MKNNTLILIVVCIIALIVLIVGIMQSTPDLLKTNKSLEQATSTPLNIDSTATTTEVASTTPATTSTSTVLIPLPVDTSTQVDITSPLPNSEIKSPITVSGRAKGVWFFEANAGLALLDSNKQPITIGNVTATTDWMTDDYVSFTGKITYPLAYKGQSGYIQFSNDNPSGLPENSKTFLVPVLFR